MQFLIDIGLSFIYLCGFFIVLAWMWRFWKMYINEKWTLKFNTDCILLEIKLPREINKSPLATEIAIASLLQGGGIGTWYARNYDGGLPSTASLEIASIEGILHFYVRINKKFRNLVESNFYAQYPGIEIVEADDYTKKIRYHHLSKDVKTWSASYKLGASWKQIDLKTGKPYEKDGEAYEMPADFLPIKTYVDYGLDEDPKEEFKVDPITPLLEFMGSIGKGEHFWYQILLQDASVYKKKFPKFYHNEVSGDRFTLEELAELRKKEIRTSGYILHDKVVMDEYGYEKTRKVEDGVDKDGKPKFKEITLKYNLLDEKGKPFDKKGYAKATGKKETELTYEEKELLETIDKKTSKPLAMVIIRLVYTGPAKTFNFGHIQNILTFTKPYKGLNSLAPEVSAPYDYDWQDLGKKRSAWRSEEIFEEYVERSGFFPHFPKREAWDKQEDMFFYPFSMKTRKTFRLIAEAIFNPFGHAEPTRVSAMNMEEVATLWHLPGQVAVTPGLPRIDSVKGNAPANLPI